MQQKRSPLIVHTSRISFNFKLGVFFLFFLFFFSPSLLEHISTRCRWRNQRSANTSSPAFDNPWGFFRNILPGLPLDYV
ncbi:hypothetical protein QBC45DRAFT_413025 [Copromyces sp. CBS 386.78]|nr:hypothetical protein QBC45DRAFT_413025 [Copromyces sp. CBS 386.78]